jgi:FMN-dependent NADH-azoreductase
MKNETKILRLNASANPAGSSSRKLGDELSDYLQDYYSGTQIHQRDLNQEIPFVDAEWIGANFTSAEHRDDAMQHRLAFSDQLIGELEWADHIVLTTPMYNFGIPAALKAWIDLVCRAGVTFRYTSNGPVGLLAGKRVDIIITTGGAPLNSQVDFVSGYLKQVFSFIGINDVSIIGADKMNVDADASIAKAQSQIEASYAAIAVQEAS